MKGLILSLPDRKERVQSLQRDLKAINIDSSIVDAIDARQPRELETILKNTPVHTRFYLGLPRVMHSVIGTPGALGCYLTHMKAWKIIAKMDHPVFIFEDDAIIRRGSEAEAQLMYDLCNNQTFDCIQSSFHMKPMYTSNTIVRFISPIIGAQSYILTPKGARMLLDKMSNIDCHVDFALGMLANVTVHDSQPFRLGLATPGIDEKTMVKSIIKHDEDQQRYLDMNDFVKIFAHYYKDPERYNQNNERQIVRKGESPDKNVLQFLKTPNGLRFNSLAAQFPLMSRRAHWLNHLATIIVMMIIIVISIIALAWLGIENRRLRARQGK